MATTRYTEPVSWRLEAAVHSAEQQRQTTHSWVTLCGVSERLRASLKAAEKVIAEGVCAHVYIQMEDSMRSPQIDGLGHATWSLLALERGRFSKTFLELVALGAVGRSGAALYIACSVELS